MTIVPVQSISEFFHENVKSTIKSLNVEATEGATRYLGDLLSDYTHLNEKLQVSFDKSYTLLHDEARNELDQAERFNKLRILGDGVLYGCGFFSEYFKSRGMDMKYLHGIGTEAYSTISDMFKAHGVDLFRELADKFSVFTQVLEDIADSTSLVDGTSPSRIVAAYERWLKSGGRRLELRLIENGINIPTSN